MHKNKKFIAAKAERQRWSGAPVTLRVVWYKFTRLSRAGVQYVHYKPMLQKI